MVIHQKKRKKLHLVSSLGWKVIESICKCRLTILRGGIEFNLPLQLGKKAIVIGENYSGESIHTILVKSN